MNQQEQQNQIAKHSDEPSNFQALLACLQKLIGIHRQLLETVRQEHEAIANALPKDLQEAVYAKEALIEGIRQQELLRQSIVGKIALQWNRPLEEITLSLIVLEVQNQDAKFSELLRSSQTALKMLAERVIEQNSYNRELLQKSLDHVHEMKRNVLGESKPKSQTYTAQGRKSLVGEQNNNARLISKEV